MESLRVRLEAIVQIGILLNNHTLGNNQKFCAIWKRDRHARDGIGH